MRKHLQEVEATLSEVAAKTKPGPWKSEDYIGGGKSRLVYLNLKIPLVRAAYKKGFSFSTQTPEALWHTWDYVWHNSTTFEAMLMPCYWARSRSTEEILYRLPQVTKWLERVDNWAHSDELSGLYARLLESSPQKVMPVFERWNRSKDPWCKRQSMVGLMYYSRMRRKVPAYATIIRFVEAHMDDEHYYVQKGVGWTLRECWNVYPEKTFSYLKKNAHRIAPAGWTAATEKLSKRERAILTNLRRKRV